MLPAFSGSRFTHSPPSPGALPKFAAIVEAVYKPSPFYHKAIFLTENRIRLQWASGQIGLGEPSFINVLSHQSLDDNEDWLPLRTIKATEAEEGAMFFYDCYARLKKHFYVNRPYHLRQATCWHFTEAFMAEAAKVLNRPILTLEPHISQWPPVRWLFNLPLQSKVGTAKANRLQ